jgi:hypothetical protein
MPAGLQCFDASGNLVVDITSRLPRFVGSAAVGPGNTPSVSNANLAAGTVWYAFQPSQIWGFINMDVSRPIFSVSGTTISWVYSAGAGTHNMQIPGTLFYGVY